MERLVGACAIFGDGEAREGGIPPTSLFVGGVTGRPQKSPFWTPVQTGSFAGAGWAKGQGKKSETNVTRLKLREEESQV